MSVNSGLRVLLGIFTVLFLGLIAFSLRDTSAKEGGPAPAFSLKTDEGGEATLSAFDDKILVLNFWATWCPPCIQEIPSLNEFQKRFADKGVVVLAVSIDRNAQKYRKFLDRIHLSFETAWDPSANVSTEYGTFQFPETYIIKHGRVVRKFAGAEDWSSDDMTQYMRQVIED